MRTSRLRVLLLLSLVSGCAPIRGQWSRTHYELYPSPGRVTVQTPTFTQGGPFFTKVGTGQPFVGLVLGPLFAGGSFAPFGGQSEAGWVSVAQMGGLQSTTSDLCCGPASVFEGRRVGDPAASSAPAPLWESASTMGLPRPARPESSLRSNVSDAYLDGAPEWIPASARMVVSFNTGSFRSSPLGESVSSDVDALPDEAMAIDPTQDVDSVTYFRGATRGGRAPWGAILKGRFDEGNIVSIVRRSDTVSRTHYGTANVYVFRSTGSRFAMAFPDPATALFGTPRQVLSMLAIGWGRAPSLVEGPLGERLPESAGTAYFFAASPVDARVRSASLAYELTNEGVRVVTHVVASDAVVARRLTEAAGRFLESARLQDRGDSADVAVSGEEVEASTFTSFRTLRALSQKRRR